MTFARGLRAILRQDPDVVMVGEIRDTETAEIAVQHRLQGTRYFPRCIPTRRWGDHAFAGYGRGAFPALFQSDGRDGAAAGSHAVSRLPPALPATDEEKRLLGITDARTVTLYHPQGCPACNHKGFSRTYCHP